MMLFTNGGERLVNMVVIARHILTPSGGLKELQAAFMLIPAAVFYTVTLYDIRPAGYL
jgi:hypothetical protein